MKSKKYSKGNGLVGAWSKGIGIGWFGESSRHSLSAKGMKTGRKSSSPSSNKGGWLDALFGLSSSMPKKSITSKYPVAEGKVGSYDALAFSWIVNPKDYDKVLEYRVWIHPKGGGDDYFHAFENYEDAKKFSSSTKGAEKPLVLVKKGKKQIETLPDAIIGKKLPKKYQ
jgi:hypothetical protein